MARGLALLVAAALAGCEAGYYTQLLRGQYDLLSRRESMQALIASPDTDPALREKLVRALQAREFASRELRLPDNGSYTKYVALHRPYVVWNVFAAPALSLTGHEWCYLFLGCLSYRGYYDEAAANEQAAQLRGEGLETYVGGVPAYSTLGWFDDPLLSTIGEDEAVVAGTIFHELAHQVKFVKGDTAFNESFATFVEQEGLRQYLVDRPQLAQAAERRRELQNQFVGLILATRTRLEAVYASGAPDEEKRRRKQAEFETLRADYAKLRASWGQDYYGAFMSGELNNARLLPFGLYFEWVPAFAALFEQSGRNWQAFYKAVDALAGLAFDERQQALRHQVR